jgi:hypothetical protein
MWPLREVQSEFAAALLERTRELPVRGVVGAGLDPAQRVQIYRNHLFVTLSDALAGAFPTVQSLVGKDFFASLARKYISNQPPHRPCLFQYGDGFAEFIEGQPACRALPYLADVARFEWDVNTAFFAEDAAALAPAALRHVAPDELPGVCLALHPAVRLCASPYPIDRIWRTSQPDADAGERVDLGEGGVALLIVRRDIDVVWHRLDPAEYAFLAALDLGLTIAQAQIQAESIGDFDLVASLSRHLSTGTFTQFHLNRSPT